LDLSGWRCLCRAGTTTKEHVADTVTDDGTGHGTTHGASSLSEHARLALLSLRVGGSRCWGVVLLLGRVGGGVSATAA